MYVPCWEHYYCVAYGSKYSTWYIYSHLLLHEYILDHSSWVILLAYTLTQEVLVGNVIVAIRRRKYAYVCGLRRRDRVREKEKKRETERGKYRGR